MDFGRGLITAHRLYAGYVKLQIFKHTIVRPCGIDIVTNINNNIKNHFLDYVNKYVNVCLNCKAKAKEIDKIKSKEIRHRVKKKFNSILFKLKKDLIKADNNYESDIEFHEWLDKNRKNIIRKDKFLKDSIFYDIEVKPQDYLKTMFYINSRLEIMNDNTEYPVKLFQIIPQRTNIIPKHIMLDSCGLADLTVTEKISEYLSNITKYKDDLWKSKFKTNRREFRRKNYVFDYMIRTDGVACSILLIKSKDGKPLKETKKMKKENAKKLEYPYIENVEITDEMKGKRLVTFGFKLW